MTSIKEIMKKDFSKLSSSDNVESAVELMEKRGVDYLLIEEKGEIKGVVTSHELVGYPSSRPVLDCKIKPIATIAEKTRLNEALKVLEEKEVNFLVIVNKKGSPIGVINKEIIIYFLYQEVKKSNKAKKKQITERKRAEEALRESEERYRLLAESAQDPIFIIDSDIRIQYTNQFAARLLGYRPEELIGKYIEEVFHPDLSNSLKYGVQTVFESGEPLHAEGLFTLPDKELWLDTQLIPLKTESGEIKFILGISRDITERKWAEETLKESEERYRTIFETTGTAMLIGEEDTTISMINAEFEKLCGYSKEKVEGKKSWIEFIVKADQERMKEYHRLRMIDPNAAPPHYEFQFIDKRGNVKDAFITLDLIPGTKKTVVSLINITERKRAEEALRESEMRFRTIVETAPSLLIITDAVGNNLYVSHNCEEITGYTQEELLGELIWWVHEDDTSRAKEIFERTFRDGVGGKDFEYKAVKMKKRSLRVLSSRRLTSPSASGQRRRYGHQKLRKRAF
jgi:PAS domain S-box-containing protein